MLDIETKLKDLDARNHGDYWIVRCPSCGHREAYVYFDDVEKAKSNKACRIPIRCNRMNKCGKTSYIDDVLIDNIPKVVKNNEIGITNAGLERLQNLVYLSKNIIGFDFDWRGISNKTLKENGVIYLKKGLINFMKNSGEGSFHKKYYSSSYKDRNLIFPINDYDGHCMRLLLRNTSKVLEKKEIGMKLQDKSSELWNRKDIINPEMKNIFITEGVPDALSIKEVNQNYGVVAIPGVRKYKQFVKELQIKNVKNKRVVICFDNDTAGYISIKMLSDELKKLNIQYIFFDLNGYKDMNDFLISNKKLFIDTVKYYAEYPKKIDIKKTKYNKKEGKFHEQKNEVERKGTSKFRFVKKGDN